MTRSLPLICLALTHTLVDTCALLIAPLWPRLEAVYSFELAMLSLAFIVQSLPSSISQVVFGFLRDRRSAPIWLWLGPLIAAVFLTTIGLWQQPLVLFALLLIGGIGVGAFHPEAAVLAGRLLPGQRTRGISLFMFGGSLGLALGPVISGLVVGQWGLPGLAGLTVPIVGLIVLLRWIGGLGTIARELVAEHSRDRSADDSAISMREMFEGRVGFAMLMLAVCSLRLVPNMAMDKVLAFALQRPEWGFTETQIGFTQAVFLASASVGMLLMVARFRTGWEKAFLVGCPLAAIPLIALLGWPECPRPLFFIALSLSGVVLWGTSPAMVSYAQQQFPKGAGLASALTMGMSWGIGGLIQAPITSYFQTTGSPQTTFWACIPCLLAAGLIALRLPGCTAEATDLAPVLTARSESSVVAEGGTA